MLPPSKEINWPLNFGLADAKALKWFRVQIRKHCLSDLSLCELAQLSLCALIPSFLKSICNPTSVGFYDDQMRLIN